MSGRLYIHTCMYVYASIYIYIRHEYGGQTNLLCTCVYMHIIHAHPCTRPCKKPSILPCMQACMCTQQTNAGACTNTKHKQTRITRIMQTRRCTFTYIGKTLQLSFPAVRVYIVPSLSLDRTLCICLYYVTMYLNSYCKAAMATCCTKSPRNTRN